MQWAIREMVQLVLLVLLVVSLVTSMTLGSRLKESSFPPYSRDRTAIVITVLRLCMADPRCPDLTHASDSFSSVCLSPTHRTVGHHHFN